MDLGVLFLILLTVRQNVVERKVQQGYLTVKERDDALNIP
jgi:hypothetical protein